MIHNKLSLKYLGLATWMVIVAFVGRHFVTSASAFSSRQLAHNKSYLTRIVGHRGGSQVLRAVNGAESNKKDPSEKGTPATGWNHNQPTNPNFWKSEDGQPQSDLNPTLSEAASETSEQLRTGWLHNTKSKSKPESIGPGGNQEEKVGGISKAQQRLKQAMLQQERNHRILTPPAFHACGGDRQIAVTEHRLSIPVNREDKRSPRIDLAFSIVEEIKDINTRQWFESLTIMSPQERATAYIQKAALKNADEMVIYLQGGPGFGSPTPVVGLAFAQDSSWGAKALNKYKRVVLMDQRGTGKSTPITKQSLERRFPGLFVLDSAGGDDIDAMATSHPTEYANFQEKLQEATDYMAHFRADNIVKDAEYMKDALMLPNEPGTPEPGPRPWGLALGQSFGGFCMMSYLSLIEHPPKVCILTGGIAPMLTPAYEAYSKLWDRVKERSLLYYDMYPGDIQQVKEIVKKLLEEPATLPSGGKLTARRFLQYGMSLGGSPSSFASMHNLFQTAFLHGTEDQEGGLELSRAFVKYFDSAQPFDDHPIYYWMHESIYANGPENSPTNWAANRAYEDKIKTPSEFDYRLTSQLDSDTRPVLFFGEMVFPWMAEDYAECSGVGCKALVESLAAKSDWGSLYDGEHMRRVLSDGTSCAAAAVYYNDMYVDFDCSMKVAARGGPLEKCKVYVTNEYQHSGLRDDGSNIFSKLYGMATGSIRTPS